MEQNRNVIAPTEDSHELYVDEKTREKIRKHWSDPNDKITPADIENVNTDIYARPETPEEDAALEQKADELSADKAPSAWDIKTND